MGPPAGHRREAEEDEGEDEVEVTAVDRIRRRLTATIRRLAVLAEADPRSVEKRLRGEHLRGLAGHRIDRVLAEHGLAPGALMKAAS